MVAILGSILGSGLIGSGTGKIAATALGGILSDKAQQKRDNLSLPGARLRQTVNAAREMGIHELEALRSGIGGANIQNSPRIGTNAVIQNSFDTIAAERQSRERSKERQEEFKNALRIEKLRGNRGRLGWSGDQPTDLSPIDKALTPPEVTVEKLQDLPEDAMFKPFIMPDGTRVWSWEDFTQVLVGAPQWPIQKGARILNDQHARNQQNADMAETERTIRENIKRGNPDATEQEIQSIINQITGR
jgi:hypothetical protein